MRQTHVPSKVTRSTKLRAAQYSPELGLRSKDFHVPENLIFPALATSKVGQNLDFLKLDGMINSKIFLQQNKILLWSESYSSVLFGLLKSAKTPKYQF